MAIESLKVSVTVNGNVEPLISAEPEQRTEIKRSTILNAPTKDDRADTLLPLIPGVVRGPDGLINMKGARSSQSGALVNSASVIDPVTGNPAMSLPIDVVESATVIANPYDPEYGRLAGAVSKIETTTSNFDRFSLLDAESPAEAAQARRRLRRNRSRDASRHLYRTAHQE